MLQLELDSAIRIHLAEYNRQSILFDNMETILTPESICNEYIKDNEYFSMYSQKKQKELRKKFDTWKTQFPSFQQDVEKMTQNSKIKKNMEKAKEELDYINQYTQIHMTSLCELLTDHGFLQSSVLQKNEFTMKGKFAAHLHEIHPLLGTDMIEYTSFKTYTAKQMVAILSIFTDISIPEECRANVPPKGFDPVVIKDIHKLIERAEIYKREEEVRGLYSPEIIFMYDLIDVIGEWCDYDTEQGCKYFIQKTIGDREISLGDFTKAVLKIMVIVKEFKILAEQIEDLSFLTTLNEIEPLILKYVATNQSLYV
jgi:superfamily II RNA helicase